MQTTADNLKIFGNQSLDHPTFLVEIRAPISGIITDQQVTNQAGVAGIVTSPSGLGAPSPFTITSLDYLWILCDVYENDLPSIKVGDTADIRVNGYPDRVLKGRVSNIGAVLDPNLRSAKVRVEVQNPGFLKVGMFVTATFAGQKSESHAEIPATAILHLHDREWVYTPLGNAHFKRQEVVAGAMLPNNMQEVVSGLKPGDQVVERSLVLQNTVEQ